MRDFEVFLAEDNPDHADLATDCLTSGSTDLTITHFDNGAKLLTVLRKRSEAGEDMPNLLLLDINMPGMNGFDVLAEMKAHEDMRLIPVVIVSTSRMARDVRQALTLNANSYSTKSRDFDLWEATLLGIRDYWRNIDHSRDYQNEQIKVERQA